MIAARAGPAADQVKRPGYTGERSPITRRWSLLMNEVLPNGLLGVALAGLLAAFMAGMAANISAFNTVFSYDLWQAVGAARTGPTATTCTSGGL